MILFSLWLATLVAVSKSISVVNPLDEQLPPIARVGQNYNWTISPATFNSNSSTTFTASSPNWLSFDPSSKSFAGIPTSEDQGQPEVTVTAHEAGSSATSSCTIYVTNAQAPTLNIPLEQQFYKGNPSLSSVYIISRNSSLYNGVPALRVPHGWSFSVGFLSETFKSYGSDLFYDVLLDGFPLWRFRQLDSMDWNQRDLTLGGSAPPHAAVPSPTSYRFGLHVSDKAGYSASSLPFDVVIADHDLSKNCSSLPTVNVTALEPFNFALSSPSDFVGVLIDDLPIHPSNISELSVDTSGCEGVQYDPSSRTLSGNGLTPNQVIHLPTTLTAMNQSLHVLLSLSVVPSFFASNLPNITVPDDGKVLFGLQPYFSNATGQGPADVDVTVSFDVPDVADILTYDGSTFTLQGTLPVGFDHSIITATFTAYDRITLTTSHATLSILCETLAKTSKNHSHKAGLSFAEHKKLVLGLGISFGVIGGVCALAVLLAAFRRCSRVQDSALTGDEARKWWSETDKKWYGLEERSGYGWTQDTEKQRLGVDTAHLSQAGGDIGLGIGFPSSMRSPAPPSNLCSVGSTTQSPGFMKKGEFMNRIRETVRHVSDKYNSVRSRRPLHPSRVPIGKPILINTSSPTPLTIQATSSSPLAGENVPSPATVHFIDQLPHSRRRSVDSGESFASIQAHANEAVVQTATRVPSVSHPSIPESLRIGRGVPPRPRLVPFTSATRVPNPQAPSPNPDGTVRNARVTSHTATATVWQKNSEDIPADTGSSDDLSVGIQYVRALGSDTMPTDNATSTLTVSTNVRSSFSSFESSEPGHGRERSVRMIVRAGEDFKFRVTLPPAGSPESSQYRGLVAKLASGENLPRFLHVDLHSNKRSGGVEFYGAASARDVGDLNIVICLAKEPGICLARVLLQVAGN